MKSVKLFEQYISESQGSQFSHAVLRSLEPTILEMVENIRLHIIKQYNDKGMEYNVNEYELKMIRLSLIIDMLKSFEKYTEPTDKLIKIQASAARKGIEISAIIERDGQQYDYYTEAIGAGGYNIQSYHYRYLTKTKLPNGKIKGTLADEYAQQLKKLTKAEKINAEIKGNEAHIAKQEADIEKALKLNDEEILAAYYAGDNVTGKPYKWPTWEQIIKNGAAKNYNNDEAYYNQQKAESEAYNIESWKKRNIFWKQQNIEALTKNIKKLEIKLQALTNQ